MERWIKQADRDRQASHDFKQVQKILALEGQQTRECSAPALFRFRHDHLAHGANALRVEEHVFGAAKPDAFRAKAPGGFRIQGRFRIGAHAQAAHLIRPTHESREIARKLRFHHGDSADENLTRRTIQRNDLAGFNADAARAEILVVVIHRNAAAACNTGPAHTAGDNRRVAGHAAACG